MNTAEFADFIDRLNASKQAQNAFELREEKKRQLLDSLSQELDDTKDGLREAMTFRLVDGKGNKKHKSFDERGQEFSADTFGSTKKGQGLSEEGHVRVNRAMQQVVALSRKAVEATDSDGDPLFTAEDIRDEFFTPLVREGLLPETLVRDQYSEVQQLLKATYSGYRETIEETRKSKLENISRTRINVSDGNVLDFFKGSVNFFGELTDRLNEGDPAFTRRFEVFMQGVKTGYAGFNGIKAIVSWVPDDDGDVKALTRAEKWLDSAKYNVDDPESIDPVDLTTAPQDYDGDDDRVNLRIEKFSKYIEKDLATIVHSDAAQYTLEGLQFAVRDILGKYIAGIAVTADDLSKLKEKLQGAKQEATKRDAARWAVEQIDQALAEEIHVSLLGIFEKQVDLAAIQDATTPKTDGTAIVSELAKALQRALIAAAPVLLEPTYGLFTSAAGEIAKAFQAAANGKALSKSLQKAEKNDPQMSFEPIVAAARQAISANKSDALVAVFDDPDVIELVKTRAIFGSEEELAEELERSQEELREYERMLVLVDEGGIQAAQQRTIETLIAQIQQDRKTVSLVKTIGSSLQSLGGTTTSIVAGAADGFSEVGASMITGPLKYAQLLVTYAIHVREAAERHRLLSKFKSDIKRAKVARSSLSSTIQGFLDNKIEQCVFRDIEIALEVVQMAAVAVGTIPTPLTIAIGKTASAVNSAAQQSAKLTESIYNEDKLTKAWKITKAALDNPRDRRTGLRALRINPTLGMHAVAWAAMTRQPPDPIARMVLDSLGLNEQSLQVSGTEQKVRHYLETVLHEDRKMTDPRELKTDWAPTSFDLSAKDWFIITRRAAEKATPKLRLVNEDQIYEALKPLDGHDIATMTTDSRSGVLAKDDIDRCLAEAQNLCDLLRDYQPSAEDGSDHDDMETIADEYAKRAHDHLRKLEEIRVQNLLNSE